MALRSLAELCEVLRQHGMSAEPHGDAQVDRVATLEDADRGAISFLSNPKYEKQLATTRASAVLVRPDVVVPPGLSLIRVADPYAAVTALIVALHGHRRHPPRREHQAAATIAPTARLGDGCIVHHGVTIEDNVVIGRNARIYPGVYVGPRARIGDDVVLFPNVVIYDDCVLGDRVTIHAGTVIGNDGLGYAPVSGRWLKIPQIGMVEIASDVEIGANCSIDRATLGKTFIGGGTKFSNLIAIGHGTRIGENCMLVAQVGIAGSVGVGSGVVMAGQAGIVGHVRIGDRAVIGAKAGVINDVPEGETVLGAPAIPARVKKREAAIVGRLPEMRESLRELQRANKELLERVATLEARLHEVPAARPVAAGSLAS